MYQDSFSFKKSNAKNHSAPKFVNTLFATYSLFQISSSHSTDNQDISQTSQRSYIHVTVTYHELIISLCSDNDFRRDNSHQ